MKDINSTNTNTEETINPLPNDDPKITASGDIIKISPLFFDYNLLMAFVLFLIGLFIIYAYPNEDNKTNVVICIILMLSAIVSIINQAKNSNTLIINTSQKTIQIIPNILISLFLKEKKIQFNEIKKVSYITNGFWLAYRKSIIVFTLNDERKVSVLRIQNEDNAGIFARFLLSIIK